MATKAQIAKLAELVATDNERELLSAILDLAELHRDNLPLEDDGMDEAFDSLVAKLGELT